MAWPDIFFKARKTHPVATVPPPFKPAPDGPKPPPGAPQPPSIKPVPVALGPQARPNPTPIKIASAETSTRTLPAMHGVVLRHPARVVIGPPATSTEPAPPPEPIKNIEQLMAEADPVRTLSQTGSVRMLKRLSPEPDAAKATPVEPPPVKSEPAASVSPSPWPSFPSATGIPQKTDTAPVPVSTEAPKQVDTDSPFILKQTSTPTDTPQASPPTPAPLNPSGSIFHRRARLTELARIVLPPKREETQRLHTPPESSPTVVPPAFPVAAMTVRANHTTQENPQPAKASVAESPFLERAPTESTQTEAAPPIETPAPLPDLPPVIDPAAHQPEPSAEFAPKIDPEAHRPPPAPPVPSTGLSAPPVQQEKREFHLANGEHVAGTVLSETPEAVYIEHATLGVITIPRAQIAKRLVEIILINGDRIVGDIMAETADMLYVRHASLGMLSVPRAQRSTRVVEAILKDGDRILGEVLTETDTFTVIRSATLGTITVPHSKMAMLNRKIEQIEMKSLPPPVPPLMEGQPPA